MKSVVRYLIMIAVGLLIIGCSRQQKLDDSKVEWPIDSQADKALVLRSTLLSCSKLQGTFSMKVAEEYGLLPHKGGSLPYDMFIAIPNFKDVAAGDYILYSPFASDPALPEVVIPVSCDGLGNSIICPSKDFKEKLIEHKITIKNMPIHISLFANPGYCSDWYLLGNDKVYHTTLTYKPLHSRSIDGKELVVAKKEPGGNILEVLVSGFPSESKVLCYTDVEGECRWHIVTTDAAGSGKFFFLPHAKGKQKGIVKVFIIHRSGRLQTSCDWDSSTLRIKGKRVRMSPDFFSAAMKAITPKI